MERIPVIDVVRVCDAPRGAVLVGDCHRKPSLGQRENDDLRNGAQRKGADRPVVVAIVTSSLDQ
jgi:hypothetical protein